MKYCKKCVYPDITVNLKIQDNNICSSCKTHESFQKLTKKDWEKRRLDFEKIVNEIKSKNTNDYDCLIPVSGGKDSYYQTHKIVKDYKLKPLLVTYHGNNYLPTGDINRDNMRKVFDADHIVWGPSVDVLKKLNKICFEKMGDMNWHAHCGIMTSPIILAIKFKIPFIIWGEIAWDISGMYKPNDFVEFSAKTRHEHSLRGFEWNDLINDNPKTKITEKDMLWAKYPKDNEIINLGLRGLYLGNFFKWDPNKQVDFIKKKYKFTLPKKKFQRTYRLFSNLDDRYENGIHDLMKFIKFGYGRASDHASKDIRAGYMTRQEGIKMVKKYDHVVSDDLYYWLDYINEKEDYFWKIADTFRDPRVWTIKKNKWWKENIWGGSSPYGKVFLNDKQIENFNKRKEKLSS